MSQEKIVPEENKDNSILGLSTTELAGLKVEELLNNKTAITMLIHYYKKLVDDNNALKNEKNTLDTYVRVYERKKTFSSIGAILLALSNILIAFGVNLLTGESYWPGSVTLFCGVSATFVGLYYSYRNVEK
jgi:hypothetical protein